MSEQEEINFERLNALRKAHGLPAVVPQHTRKPRTFYISDAAEIGLRAIARHEGYADSRGGSISKLMEVIGLGAYKVVLADPETDEPLFDDDPRRG